MKKLCLVTGASSGIGKFTALEIAKNDFKVVVVCRNKNKAEDTVQEIKSLSKNNDVEYLLCDFSSQKQIKKAAEEFKSKYDKLDILLNNAGLIKGEKTLTEDRIEETFAVNHMGYFLFTNLLLDIIKSTDKSRIVNVSSEAHRMAFTPNFDDINFEKNKYSSFPAYAQSKLNNILFTYELSKRLEGTTVTTNCLHPGTIASNFGQSGHPIFAFLARLSKPFLKTVEQGSQTNIYLALSKDVENVTGKYFKNKKIANSTPVTHNKEYQKRLWEISENLIRID